MKTILLLVNLFFVGIFCHVLVENSAEPVKIITFVNHTFQLELNDFKQILEAENIKDRHVTILSIAGAYRQGKSFLLNFFLRYLNAKVNKLLKIV